MAEEEKQKKWIDKIYMLHDNEIWLNEQAGKGLILERFDKEFAYFNQMAAEDNKYKIVILNKKKAEDQIKVLERQGFTFVGSSDEYYIFSIGGKYGNVEPKMNEEMIVFARKWLDKQMLKSFTLSMLIPIPLIFAFIMVRDKLIQTIVEFPDIWAILLGVVLVATVYEDLRRYQAVRRTKKCLLEHEEYQSGWNWKKWKIKRAIAYTLGILTLVLSITDNFIDPEKCSINDLKKVMPIVLIQDIEQDSEQTERGDVFQGVANEDNYAEIKHTLLAPKQYFSWQENDGNHMRVLYYEVAVDKLAEPLARELPTNGWVDIENEDIKKVDFKGLDVVYTWQENGIANVSASKGKRVMCIFYIGDLQVKDLLREMAEVL